jgi:hypothetical protein
MFYAKDPVQVALSELKSVLSAFICLHLRLIASLNLLVQSILSALISPLPQTD